MTSSLGERTSASRSWAAWLTDFNIEVTKGILLELEEYKIAEEVENEAPKTAKMSMEQWKQHVLNDHMPFSRECITCLQGGGRSRQHRKVPHPDAMDFEPGHLWSISSRRRPLKKVGSKLYSETKR